MTQNLRRTLAFQVRAVSDRPVDRSMTTEFRQGLSATVVNQITDRWAKTNDTYARGRQEHYFPTEFLMERTLLNNLSNLGLVDGACQAPAEYDQDPSLVLEEKLDATLEDGGLGRLTTCFLDSCATLGLPVVGYGILYRYGLFKQLFDKDFQTEHPNPQMEEDYPFVIHREEAQRIVSYAGLVTHAAPYDVPVTNYGTKNINTLRLWRTEPTEEFDYDTFSSQCSIETITDRERTNDISRVLYPNDTTFGGKALRVRQQYFLCSTSLQVIVDNYVEYHSEDPSDFARYNAIRLDDTHPILIIPELIYLLMDEHDLGRGDIWKIVLNTFAYTNHVVLIEALEKWEMMIFD